MAKVVETGVVTDPEATAAGTIRGARAIYILGALVVGLLLGAMAARMGDGLREPALKAASLVGGLWLDALKMTVIPLIFALLVTGIARGAEAAKAGRIAARSIMWFVAVCTASAIFGAVATMGLLDAFPLPADAGEALRAGLAAIDPAVAGAPVPQVADFFRSIIPSNVISAAAEGQVLQLVIFAFLFALALTRIEGKKRQSVVALFEGVGDALLVLIGWCAGSIAIVVVGVLSGNLAAMTMRWFATLFS